MKKAKLKEAVEKGALFNFLDGNICCSFLDAYLY